MKSEENRKIPLENPQMSAIKSTSISPFIILILLFVFAPLAWYFMWKEPRYHRWFPFILLIYSVLFLTLLFLLFFFVYPQLNELYQSLNIERPFSWINYLPLVLIVVSISQIFLSFLLFRKLKSTPILPKNFLVVTLVFLSLSYIGSPVFSVVMQLSVVSPIYTLTDSFNEDINAEPTSAETSPSKSVIQVSPTLIPTSIPTQLSATMTPQPQISSQSPTNTQFPSQNDTTPPSISMTGPEDGSTLDFKSFCFPMYVTDNVSKEPDLQVRFRFDSPGFNDWSTNYAPCYNDVGNGSHTFAVEARDKAGNTTSISRTFTVQVN